MNFRWGVYLFLLTGICAGAGQAAALHFRFREPGGKTYRVDSTKNLLGAKWIEAAPEDDPANPVQLSSRVVLQMAPAADVKKATKGSALRLVRRVTESVFIFEASDALTAARESERIANLPGVITSHPIMRRAAQLDGPYAAKPNDAYFANPQVYSQWYLEQRSNSGAPVGADLNVRAAWPFTRGNGITIAIGDSGFETNHPDLAERAVGAPHFNFEIHQPNGMPPTSTNVHGTAVAGLAAATGNNGIGICGVAPEALLASWVVFGTNGNLVDDESLMDAFQYQSNIVQVQNYSWGPQNGLQVSEGLLPSIGISNAINFGRNGLGVVMVRSAGNFRPSNDNANDSGFRNDPRAICVAATRYDGRVASYSNPGACVLVSAIGAEDGEPFMTTDRQGPLGYNTGFLIPSDPNFWNYSYDDRAFGKTSASAPQISGVAALILSANPNLGYRDVQQILLLSARHFDFADPDLYSNGAGLLVDHNVGFGMPDAGEAVRLARRWPNRPAFTNLTLNVTNSIAVPDAGLRLWITGQNVPTNLVSVSASPSLGPHPDVATLELPFIDVGLATNIPAVDLTNKAALIQRGVNNFSEKINNAAAAGAAFAVVFNNSSSPVFAMGSTDFVPIPALFIAQTEGESLRSMIQTNSSVRGQLKLSPIEFAFTVTNTWLCEHVGVKLTANHPARGHLRVTLLSPSGTRSILQRLNNDTNSGPNGWTYWSTHHFYESSAGTWTVAVTDELTGGAGSVEEVSLTINGVPLDDSDHDGLDDNWETAKLGSLTYGPKDDPDKDGYSNAREQISNTEPLQNDFPLQLDLSLWNSTLARLSWPSSTNFTYQVWSGTNVTSLTLTTTVAGKFPETEWFLPSTNRHQFVRIVAEPVP